MKSPFALPAAAAATLALLSACGQTGPLYMSKPPARAAAPAQPAAPAATEPAPAPVTTVNPPAPTAGTSTPPAGSNSNDTQAPQSPPATHK